MLAMTARVTWQQVVRWRWHRQLLTDPAADAAGVATRLCGIHAQVTSASALIAGLRIGKPAALDACVWTERSLVRTWAMRGTLHLLPAAELDLWVGALTDRDSRRRFPPSWERVHGVGEAQLHAITDAVGAVLGATPLSRVELAEAVVAELGDPTIREPLSTGWGALLKPAAARGLLCSGPAEDGAVSFVAPAAWLGRALEPLEPAVANREVLLRFLAANGPATASDVARWWGEQPAPAKRWIREHADALAAVEVDGEPGFVVRAEDLDELLDTPDAPAGDVGLLPGFDPWVIAPRSHRDRAVPAGFADRVSRTSGWISPVLVADGAVLGTWAHELRGGELVVTVSGFAPLAPDVRTAAEAGAARYAELLGADGAVVRMAA
jgi:Winged helix DNA-binding domain